MGIKLPFSADSPQLFCWEACWHIFIILLALLLLSTSLMVFFFSLTHELVLRMKKFNMCPVGFSVLGLLFLDVVVACFLDFSVYCLLIYQFEKQSHYVILNLIFIIG